LVQYFSNFELFLHKFDSYVDVIAIKMLFSSNFNKFKKTTGL